MTPIAKGTTRAEVDTIPRATTRVGEHWDGSGKRNAAGNRRGSRAGDTAPPTRLALDSACRVQLEFHQLDRRWEHLRVRHPGWECRFLASLAESGQQVPIVMVAADGQPNRFVVVDGYTRVAAPRQLGWDKVQTVVWPMNDPPPRPHPGCSTVPGWHLSPYGR